jgi:flagellar protein FliS
MSTAAHDEYLAQQVLTAPPERLQLMLIEAAISAAQRARTLWQAGWTEPVSVAILRCQKIVAQILGRLAVNSQDPLVSQVTSVYTFVYRTLIAAHVERRPRKLDDALAVLDVERETWRQVCSQRAVAAPHVSFSRTKDLETDLDEGGVSFEA